MGRGGGRGCGAGRPKGAATKKSREIVDAMVVRGVKMPLEYMLAVVGDETATQARRDQMAIASAPFCHPRLAVVSTPVVNSRESNSAGGTDSAMQIIAVPRGAKVSIKDSSYRIDGEATELRPVKPFTGTAPLSALTDQCEYRREPEPEHERFDVAEAEPPQNILVLESAQPPPA